MRGTPRPPELLPETPENYPERVPDFTSEAEEQEFWATHSSGPYQGQGELVFVGRDEYPTDEPIWSERLLIPVSPTTSAGLERRSGQLGETVEDLVREWLEDRLHAETEMFGADVERKATA